MLSAQAVPAPKIKAPARADPAAPAIIFFFNLLYFFLNFLILF
jgi:hypothetical protein